MFLLMQNVKNLLTCKSFLLRCITLYVKLNYEHFFIVTCKSDILIFQDFGSVEEWYINVKVCR